MTALTTSQLLEPLVRFVTAMLHSVGANADHGLRRTNADKRRAVELLLKDEEWSKRSDRWIAEKCGVGNKLVGDLRRELCSEHSSSSQRTGQDGKTRKQPSKPQPRLTLVQSANLHRRHLNESQRAVIATKLATLPNGGDGRNQLRPAPHGAGMTQSSAARLLDVGKRTVQRARQVIDAAPASKPQPRVTA